jgi:hypothetical protein
MEVGADASKMVGGVPVVVTWRGAGIDGRGDGRGGRRVKDGGVPLVVTWRGAGIGGRIVLVILWYCRGTCSY